MAHGCSKADEKYHNGITKLLSLRFFKSLIKSCLNLPCSILKPTHFLKNLLFKGKNFHLSKDFLTDISTRH